MASSTLAIPPSYHQSIPSIKKSKLETKKVRSEDELLKFFLHGSYDVQRGNIHSSQIEENQNQIISIQDETDEQKIKSRCMFEETYMINISVKQPAAKPSSKQIDVRIEKAAASDNPNPTEKIDDDEISSIFDEEDNDDQVDSVIFNEINSTSSETPITKLTLADMINKTLTTIPAISMDNLNKIGQKNSWYIEQQNAMKTRKTSEEILSVKNPKKIIKTPPPPPSTTIQQPILTTNIKEDEKLFEYLDYLETKEESNQQTRKSPPMIIQSESSIFSQTKTSKSASKIPSKYSQQESIPIIDLEQLCRSLTVNDLKDELIRKKIYELKILIDEQHRKPKSQIPLVKPRKDNLPILIAMPPVVQQRRRTTMYQPTATVPQSKTGSLQAAYNTNYQEMIPNYNMKQYPQRQIPPTNSTRKYQYT
jgi:hypothetical protein